MHTAWLLDRCWPEFNAYLKSKHSGHDTLMTPLDGAFWNKPHYAWYRQGFRSCLSFPWHTLYRTYRGLRNIEPPYTADARLAKLYAKQLKPEQQHLVLSQNLLPHLWRLGVLRDRSFDVLLASLPFYTQQARLDLAAQLHPNDQSMPRFPVPDELCRAEVDGLLAARRIITPHAELAEMFAKKSRKLSWQLPFYTLKRSQSGRHVVFPANASNAKGAYELRDVIRALDIPLLVLSARPEDKEFWRGTSVTYRAQTSSWLEETALVVLPAFVEGRPYALLQALAANIPVIATRACGVAGLPGVTLVPAGNVSLLQQAVAHHLSC